MPRKKEPAPPVSQEPQAPLDPPHNVEAECLLLGGILVNNHMLWSVAEIVEPADFFDGLNARIFEVTRDLVRQGRLCNPVTLKHILGDVPVGEITLNVYLARLAAEAAGAATVAQYAHVVRECSQRRSLIARLQSVVAELYDTLSFAATCERAEEALHAARLGDPKDTMRSVADVVNENVRGVNAAFMGDTPIGIRPPLAALGDLIGPMMRGEMTVVAAAEGAGKTALAMQIVRAKTRPDDPKEAEPCLFLSGEMTATQVIAREQARAIRVPVRKLREASLNQAEMEALIDTAASFRREPLWIDDATSLSVGRIRDKARRLMRRTGRPLAILAIDHLQLLKPDDPRNPVEGVKQLVNDLKALAKELDTHIVLLCQLTKAYRALPSKRPNASHLYGGAAIAQAADATVFLHNEAYWLKTEEPDAGDTARWLAWKEKLSAAEGFAEMFTEKCRSGAGFMRRQVRWFGEAMLFADKDTRSPYEEAAAERREEISLP